MPVIKVILGSTRPERFGIQPANWIMELSKEYKSTGFELVDLAEVNLPLLDEPVPAIYHNYSKDHTKKWAKIIDEADGFIFVTPEYNHGMPAALKNAIDFLAKEWYYKPVAFISYGTAAGGTRSIEQFREVAGWLRMYDLHSHVILPNYWGQLNADGKFIPTKEQNEDGHHVLKNITFWAQQMKPAREALAK